MSDQTLEVAAVEAEAQDNSTPAEELKQEAEQGEIAEAEEQQEGEQESQPEETVEQLRERLNKERETFEKRIGRKTAHSKQLEEKVQKLEQEMQAIAKKSPAQEDDARPKMEDFSDYNEYDDAIRDYDANKRVQEILQQEKQAELQKLQQAQAAEKQKVFISKEADFRKEHADYDDVANDVYETVNGLMTRGLDVSHLVNAVLEFDNSPALVYELGKDDGLIEDLAQMSQVQMVRELVKLEAGISPMKNTKNVDLPKPIKPLRSKSGAKPDSELTGAQLRKKHGLL